MSETPFDFDLALGALRDDVREPGDGGEATRERVLQSMRAATLRRRRLRTTAVMLAACMAGSTALALFIAMSSQERPVVQQGVPPSDVRPPTDLEAPEGPSQTQREAQGPSETTEQAAPAQLADRGHPGPSKNHASAREARRRALRARGEGAPARSAPSKAVPEAGPRVEVAALAPTPEAVAPLEPATFASPAELRVLYATAHALHFRGSPVRALAAWDAYLASAPAGSAAVEARFNRAITLLRLGRHREARTALEPFARGDYGMFRKADATRLLSSLPLSPP